MITVGLDFGTHQTKVCVEEKDGVVVNYTFMKFLDTRNITSFVFPSLIGIGKNGLLSYGFLPRGYDGKIIKYFKQSTFLPNSNKMPSEDSLYFTTWYIAFILFDLEEKYGKDFSIQMGAPTDNDENHLRKVKEIATRVIVSAYRLVEDVFANNKRKFLATPIDELIKKTELVPYSPEIKEEYGLLVFPEAYACLRPLSTKGKIDKHLNLMVDIGGGTTDISFFTIEAEKSPLFDNNIGMPQIYMFNSINKGLNYLTCVDDKKTIQSSNDVIVRDESQIDFDRRASFFQDINEFVNDLVNSLTSEFKKQVKSNQVGRLFEALNNRPLVYCGGGSSFDSLLIKYGGFSEIRRISHIDWDVKSVSDMDEIIKTNLCHILSTAYGLSINSTNDRIVTKPFQDIFDGIRNAGDFKHFGTASHSKPYMESDIDY